MIQQPSLPLKVVDAARLAEELRSVLRPGGLVRDREGRARRLPRYFYEVPSWKEALDLQLTPHFALWEFLDVDVREVEAMRTFPRYVPCAVALLATALEVFRGEVGTFIHIAANGGYRSPGHALCRTASTHAWGVAANVYRVGDEWLDDEETIERYGRLARRLLPGIWTRPFGRGIGCADDHLHLDLGFVTVVPPDAPGEDPAEEEDVVAGGSAGTETGGGSR
jgi:hypothetical protein